MNRGIFNGLLALCGLLAVGLGLLAVSNQGLARRFDNVTRAAAARQAQIDRLQQQIEADSGSISTLRQQVIDLGGVPKVAAPTAPPAAPPGTVVVRPSTVVIVPGTSPPTAPPTTGRPAPPPTTMPSRPPPTTTTTVCRVPIGGTCLLR